MPEVVGEPQAWISPAEAPEGRWCIGRVVNEWHPLREGYSYSWEAGNPRQCVKIGGAWWVMDREKGELVPYWQSVTSQSAHMGWFSCSVPDITVREPDEVVVVPEGVLTPGQYSVSVR